MADLNEVRARIDELDPQIRALLMARLDCSKEVVRAKYESGNIKIYRPDREAEILANLSADVPEERKPEYLACLRKIIETSRMYQYGMLLDWMPELFDGIEGHEVAMRDGKFVECEHVVVRLTRPNVPNGLSPILCMIGDFGFNMEFLKLIKAEDKAVFELTIGGNMATVAMRKLMFSLSEECTDFCIVSVE